jgi:DNA-binding transcriptional ArsR family regulator
MSLGEPTPTTRRDPTAELRALAHPIRLRMLSLLTGTAMTAAELARELDITHANASYHLRQLLAAGQVTPAGQERIHGGTAKRYRYDLERGLSRARSDPARTAPAEDHRLVYAALALELQRRAAHRIAGPGPLTDAELWIDPATWDAVKTKIIAASDELHRAARPARTPGTIRVSATIALFSMEPPMEPPMEPDG